MIEATIQRIKKSGKIRNITAALKSENEYVSMLASWVTALVTFKGTYLYQYELSHSNFCLIQTKKFAIYSPARML